MRPLATFWFLAFIILQIESAGSQQSSQGGGVVVGGDSIGSTYITNPTIHLNLTPEQWQALRLPDPERTEEQRKLIGLLEQQLHLREGQIKSALKKIEASDVPPEQYGEKLAEYATNYVRFRQELERISRIYPDLRDLRVGAQDAIDSGNFARAREILKKAQQEAIGIKPQAAELVALEALTAALEFDYEQAGSLYQAAAFLSAADPPTSFRYTLEFAQQLLKNANENRPQDYPRVVQNLERIKAYPEFDRLPFAPRVNLDLGIALAGSALATRDGEKLKRARTIFEQLTATQKPGSQDWLSAMQSLGASNLHLDNPEAAISTYDKLRADPNGAPLVSNDPGILANLGIAFRQLGNRENDPEKKRKSMEYFKQACEKDAASNEYTKGQDRYNLAIAQYESGFEKRDVELLKDSVRSFEAALQYLKQSKHSSSWAHTKTNLGLVYLEIGRLTGEVENFKRAIELADDAMLIWQPGEVRDRWIESTFVKAEAHSEISKREKKRDHLDRLIAELDSAMEHIDHDSQSEHLMRAYIGVADANFELLHAYKDERCRARSKLYYEKAQRLLTERLLSGLVNVNEARFHFKEIQSKINELKNKSPRDRSTDVKPKSKSTSHR